MDRHPFLSRHLYQVSLVKHDDAIMMPSESELIGIETDVEEREMDRHPSLSRHLFNRSRSQGQKKKSALKKLHASVWRFMCD